MCLIVVGWQAHPAFPLVVAANRDEFYARPTALARMAGATRRRSSAAVILRPAALGWASLTQGRFAAVTNVREPGMAKGDCSRGELTRDFLTGRSITSADNFAAADRTQRLFRFQPVLLGDGEALVYYSNREHPPARCLSPGFMACPTIARQPMAQSC
jgi:uncharacterized protein with NRDE domain